MFQKYLLILLTAGLASLILYGFSTFFISSNRNYNQYQVVTQVENQDGIPGCHFNLKTHDGKIYNSKEDGKIKLIYFGFTFCPDVCPTTLLSMANLLDLLKANGVDNIITPLFITVDPERDNEEVLSNYVSAFHEKIIGLPASASDIEKVTSDWKVYYKKQENFDMPDNYTVNHLDIIFIANKNSDFIDFIKPNTPAEEIIDKLTKILPSSNFN